MKIIFIAPAGKVYLDNSQIVIDKYSKQELKDTANSAESQENFVDYIGGPLTEKLYSGYMTFKVEDILYTITTYEIRESLTEKEINYLKEYTQGQWSDGIGENFEQEPCGYVDDKPLFISPWFQKQQITTIIE